MLLYNQEITEEIRVEIKINTQKQMTTKTVTQIWDAAELVLRVKFIGMQSYLKKQEKAQIDMYLFDLKE